MKNIFVLSIALIHGSFAFAEADLNPNIFNVPAPTAPAGTGTGTGMPEAPRAPTPGVPPIAGSINPGSQQGQQSQSGGAGTNAAVGAALMAAGAAMMANPPTVPPGAILMAMGILAMMQSGEDSGAAGQSAATGAASNTNGTGTGTPTPVDPTGTAGLTAAKIKEGQAKLGEAGYKVTEKGLTTPDGTFIPSESLNSPSSMAAAGMSPSTIAAVQEGLADANAGALNGARVSSVGVNSGGGGTGGGVTEGDSSGNSASDMGNRNPFGLGADEKALLVAGKTVMFDGEPIGVRGQNIFDMIHNCYQKKRQGQHFIESEVGVATRMPASVKPKRGNR